MATKVTEGIKITVHTYFQQEQSNPAQDYYVFAYRVQIHNKNSFAVQLLRRHWDISDAFGAKREVEGEGVVGEQPIIEPGQTYEYVSGCDFSTEIGKMKGTYLLQRVEDGEYMYVQIPEFLMIYPFKLN